MKENVKNVQHLIEEGNSELWELYNILWRRILFIDYCNIKYEPSIWKPTFTVYLKSLHPSEDLVP
jgi:hypothetical protein